MQETLERTFRKQNNTGRAAWLAFGGLLALGFIVMTLRELPSMRREWKLMKM